MACFGSSKEKKNQHFLVFLIFRAIRANLSPLAPWEVTQNSGRGAIYLPTFLGSWLSAQVSHGSPFFLSWVAAEPKAL